MIDKVNGESLVERNMEIRCTDLALDKKF